MTETQTIVLGGRPARRSRPMPLISGILRIAVIAVALIIMAIPLVWIAVTAFKPSVEVLTLPVEVLPRTWTLENFESILNASDLHYVINSILATTGSTVLVLLIATPAAFALARHKFALRIGLIVSSLVLAARFIPGFMIIIPQFSMFRDWGLLDTVFGLVVMYTIMNLPIALWIILTAAAQLPTELLEAAAVDGASVARTFRSVGLPLLRPAIATAGTLSLIFAWNEFFTALIFTQNRAATAPLLLTSFHGPYGTEFGGLAVTALIVALPVLVLGFVAQRHLVSGLTAGSSKG